MKTSIKIMFLLLIILLIVVMIPIKSNATDLETSMSQADRFLSEGKQSSTATMNTTEIKDASDTLYNTLLGVGILIDLAVGSVLGIRFMMSSAEDKAKVKEALIPYIVGSFIILGAFGIWRIVVILGKNF